jgi:hypothetical protein
MPLKHTEGFIIQVDFIHNNKSFKHSNSYLWLILKDCFSMQLCGKLLHHIHIGNCYLYRVWGFTAVVIKNSIFWDITPCSLLKFIQYFGGICGLHLKGWRLRVALLAACFMLVSCLAYSSTLKMAAICSNETSVEYQWCYILELALKS